MALRVSGKNMDIGQALTERAQSQIDAAVDKYFDRQYDGHLTIEHEGSGFAADIVIHLDSGVILRAEAKAGDATSAYEQMAEHIEKRLRRYKRKLKNHRRHSKEEVAIIAQSYVLQSTDKHEELEEDFSPAIIAESSANLRSMSVSEAVMELDLSQSEIQIFLHAGHGGMNVVYRRPDGNIGWIDPALAK